MGRLLLINPAHSCRHNWDLRDVVQAMGRKAVTTPLALPLLAALTPSRWQVEIADENIRPWRGAMPDLVGITSLVTNHRRAIELTHEFHRQGVPVVMGGAQVTTVPGSGDVADAVVLGEAEEVWPGLLADFEQGRLQRSYQAVGGADFP